ncbi:MAG TPA: discoidin domain-containing protein, partial [Planctomycetaceae bacterium]
QVFQGDQNIALRKKARQSSSGEARLAPEGAVDGNTVGNDAGNPYAHTSDPANPWWEVDLGSEQTIDRMLVWNRSDVNLYSRMNHFRIRVMNADRTVVFEQVIDEAPKPSREITCQSLFVAKAPSPEFEKSAWSLLLNEKTGVDPSRHFRVSGARQPYSLEREETLAAARTIALPVARLAAAYGFQGAAVPSADWFVLALDDAKTGSPRQPVLKELQGHPQALAELLQRRPDDIDLQLTLARRRVDEGQKKLARRQPGAALTDFQSASDAFTRLLDHNPEPQWTVLKPIELQTATSAKLQLQPDGSVFVREPNGKDTFSLMFETDLKGITGLRLEVLADSRLPKGGPGWGENGNFLLNELTVQSAAVGSPDKAKAIALRNAWADFSQMTYGSWDVRGAIDGNSSTGWAVWPEVNKDHTAVFELAERIGYGQTSRLTFRLKHEPINEQNSQSVNQNLNLGNLGRFRLSATTDDKAAALSKLRSDLTSRELANLDMAIGQAFAQQGKTAAAVAVFTRGLDRIKDDQERKPFIEQIQEHQAALTLLAGQRPDDLPLQLAAAKRLAESGKKALAEQRQDEALPQLARARDVFSRLAAEHPESQWTVLQPTEMTSAGGADLTLEADGSIFVSGKNPARDNYDILAPLTNGVMTAVRLEAIPDARLPNSNSGRSDWGEFLLS